MTIDKTPKDNSEVKLSSPSSTDVLCGRGAPINKHPGNIVFRKVVKYNKELYNVCEKKDRYFVAKSIVMALEEQNPPTRFLEQNDDGNGKFTWITISKDRAIRKTVQALREKTTPRDTYQKSNLNIFKSMQGDNSDYLEKDVAWEHLLVNMMPGSYNQCSTSVLNEKYADNINKPLDVNNEKTLIGRKRSHTERLSPILSLAAKVTSSSHQESIQTNSLNNSECIEDETSSDKYQQLVSQTMRNAMNDEVTSDISAPAADFHVNIDPLKSCSGMNKHSESFPQIGFNLLDEFSHKFSDNDKKEVEMADKKLSSNDILVCDLITSTDNTKIEKWFESDSDKLNLSEIKQSVYKRFDEFIGKLVCT